MSSSVPTQPNTRKIAVIGAGLAGLVSSIQAAKHGAQVYLFDKQAQIGGNTSKVASFIPSLKQQLSDLASKPSTPTQEEKCTTCAAKLEALLEQETPSAIEFLKDLNIDVEKLCQCGDKQEIESQLQDSLREILNKFDNIHVKTNATVTKILLDKNRVVGVSYRLENAKKKLRKQKVDAVIICTEAFAAEISKSMTPKRQSEEVGSPVKLFRESLKAGEFTETEFSFSSTNVTLYSTTQSFSQESGMHAVLEQVVEQRLTKYVKKFYHQETPTKLEIFGREQFELALRPRGSYSSLRLQPKLKCRIAGVRYDDGLRVLTRDGKPIHGLYAAGELIKNEKNIVLECVVFGRLAGETAAKEIIFTMTPNPKTQAASRKRKYDDFQDSQEDYEYEQTEGLQADDIATILREELQRNFGRPEH